MALRAEPNPPPPETVQRWRHLLKPGGRGRGKFESLETLEAAEDPLDRVARAKDAMLRVVKDRFGGDGTLAKAVDDMAISSEDAIAILAESSGEKQPTHDHLAALESIVAFDGTRPSFLVKENEIDFSSSYNTGDWKRDLAPYHAQLSGVIACIGRVEIVELHIGTAFLATPSLAITNRHVAQAIAKFDDITLRIRPNIFLDFGREEWNGRKSFDRRKVEAVVFAGHDQIVERINHSKLDLAVLRVSASSLAGDLAQRHLAIGGISAHKFDLGQFVIAIGYPGDPHNFVPDGLQSKFEGVLKRLLEGEGGAKRFAPGVPTGLLRDGGATHWTATHDATTINGNSGSPLFVLGEEPLERRQARAGGLHYGGSWAGERTNWAHLLALTGNAVGYGGTTTFAQFCHREGICL